MQLKKKTQSRKKYRINIGSPIEVLDRWRRPNGTKSMRNGWADAWLWLKSGNISKSALIWNVVYFELFWLFGAFILSRVCIFMECHRKFLGEMIFGDRIWEIITAPFGMTGTRHGYAAPVCRRLQWIFRWHGSLQMSNQRWMTIWGDNENIWKYCISKSNEMRCFFD